MTTVEPSEDRATRSARPTSPRGAGHRADIQGLRALAVILVVLYHAELGAVPGGFVGVDVFFVVSGFVITRMLLGEQRATGALRLGRFYLRRIRRILPALAVLTTTTVLAAILLGSIGTLGQTVRTGWAASLFSANVFLVTLGKGGYFHAPARANPLLHTWSLSLEEQFYFVFPTLLVVAAALARRRRGGRVTRAQVAAVGAVSAASFAACVLATRRHLGIAAIDETFAFYLAPFRFWQFGVGAILAMVAHRLPSSRALAEGAGWVGLALVGWSAATFAADASFPGWIAAVPTLGTALAIVGGTGSRGSASRLLARGPATWVGDRSYSWYLWHWPVIVFARALWPGRSWVLVVAALASLLPALASYRWVEQPIRHRPAEARPTLRLGLACLVVPILAGGLALAAGHLVDRRPAVVDYRNQLRRHLDATAGCFGADDPLDGGFCTWAFPGRPTTSVDVLLVGDSNAGQFSEPVIAAARGLRRNATIRTKGVCPVSGLTPVLDGFVDRSCATFVDDLLDQIDAARPEVVVLSSASDGYVGDPRFALLDADGVEHRTQADKEASWAAGLARTIERIRATGAAVVVVQPIPKFPGWDPAECAVGRVLLAPGSCSISAPRADLLDARAAAVRAQERAVAAAGAGVALVDPFPIVCPGDPCRARHDGELWWRDGAHVSVAGAERVEPALAAGLRDALVGAA